MSKIKRMKLVPIEVNNNADKTEILKNTLILETPPNTVKTSQVESELDQILNSDLSEKEKFDIFVQIFRKFLIFKEKFDNKIDQSQKTHLKSLGNTNIPISPVLNSTPYNFGHILSNDSTLKSTFSPIVITPKSTNQARRKRLKKESAKKKIKKIYDDPNESNSSGDELNVSNWIPYNAPKSLKTISRVKSKK